MATKTSSWVGLVLEQGPYRVTSLVGEGGMGHVYRAQNLRKGGDVVLKVPRQALLEEDPEFGQRFLREVRSLVRLEHRHIVSVLDVGEYRGLPFAVLPYLAGGALRDRQPAGPQGKPAPLDPARLHGWLPQIAGALDFIHSRSYIHRDIKPENILFDARSTPFLADFGIAKALQTGAINKEQTVKTQAGVVLGTPQYMAPELILGRPYDGRVDQYALAIMLYELLSGSYPFDDAAVTAIFLLHTTKKATPLESLVPSLPGSLTNAVARGMAKNPRQRFGSCADLAAAVLEKVPAPTPPRTAKEKASAKPPPLPKPAPSGKFVEEVQAVLPCPHCRREFGMPSGLAGTWVSCPACQKSFKVPGGASSGAQRSLASTDTRGTDPATVTNAPPKPPSSRVKKVESGSSRVWLIVLLVLGAVLGLGCILSILIAVIAVAMS